mmetsp:Transcript_18327/g.37060  ORF Transcript_18327/g.37060 Transcript_18327/m.37060 type:complete len:240 (+) Transcript_18327:536-1255(+)
MPAHVARCLAFLTHELMIAANMHRYERRALFGQGRESDLHSYLPAPSRVARKPSSSYSSYSCALHISPTPSRMFARPPRPRLPPCDVAAAATAASSIDASAGSAGVGCFVAGESWKRSSSSCVFIVASEEFCWLTTEEAMCILNACRLMIFSSSVSRISSRYTETTRFWPRRCARSIACRSFIGFQSWSRKITTSAAVRLRPRPPTDVVSSIRSTEGSELKRVAIPNRCCAGTLPSSRR